jgi:transposase InsO family protein
LRHPSRCNDSARLAQCSAQRDEHLRSQIRGKRLHTTTANNNASRALDWLNRPFRADRPNQLWVSDFTYGSTWRGWLYVTLIQQADRNKAPRAANM